MNGAHTVLDGRLVAVKQLARIAGGSNDTVSASMGG